MILWSFLIGMVLCTLVLMLLRNETRGSEDDKFGSAVAMFAGWGAFGMLLMAGTYGLGIVIPGIAAALALTLRGMPLPAALTNLTRQKLPLSIGALLASVVAWIGVLNMMEELPNG